MSSCNPHYREIDFFLARSFRLKVRQKSGGIYRSFTGLSAKMDVRRNGVLLFSLSTADGSITYTTTTETDDTINLALVIPTATDDDPPVTIQPGPVRYDLTVYDDALEEPELILYGPGELLKTETTLG